MKNLILLILLVPTIAIGQGIALRATNGIGSTATIYNSLRVNNGYLLINGGTATGELDFETQGANAGTNSFISSQNFLAVSIGVGLAYGAQPHFYSNRVESQKFAQYGGFGAPFTTAFFGNGGGLSNAVALTAGANMTITSPDNGRTFNLVAAAGSGIPTDTGTGTNTLFWSTALAPQTYSLRTFSCDLLSDGGIGSINWRIRQAYSSNGLVSIDWSQTNQVRMTNIAVAGNAYLSNGVASFSANKVALFPIAVGASPFSWTNTIATNSVTVTIGAGIVTAVSVNGTSLASGLTFTGLTPTPPLQPGEWVTVTYSSTPTMFGKPF